MTYVRGIFIISIFSIFFHFRHHFSVGAGGEGSIDCISSVQRQLNSYTLGKEGKQGHWRYTPKRRRWRTVSLLVLERIQIWWWAVRPAAKRGPRNIRCIYPPPMDVRVLLDLPCSYDIRVLKNTIDWMNLTVCQAHMQHGRSPRPLRSDVSSLVLAMFPWSSDVSRYSICGNTISLFVSTFVQACPYLVAHQSHQTVKAVDDSVD